jgi:GLPGLI family protein
MAYFQTALLFLISFSIQAQSDSLPIGRVFYTQQVNLPADTDENGRTVLLFNQARSVYIHLGVPQTTNLSTDEDGMMHVNISDSEGYPIYKLHQEKKIFSKISCFKARGGCIITDTLGVIEWTLHPERKRLGTFECRRATGDFGNRTYEAWYAPDIPVSSGPHKLAGLPGLILEAYTPDKKVQFLFNSLEISPQTPGLIKKPSGKDIGMNYQEIKRAIIEHCISVEKLAASRGQTVTITVIRDLIEKIEEN